MRRADFTPPISPRSGIRPGQIVAWRGYESVDAARVLRRAAGHV